MREEREDLVLNNSFEQKLERESKASRDRVQPQEENETRPVNSIKPLFDFLTKLFSDTGHDPESFQKIEENQKSQLKNFLVKQFSFEGEQFLPKKTKKRNEEYIKFVTKRGFKSLFNKFKESDNHNISGQKL